MSSISNPQTLVHIFQFFSYLLVLLISLAIFGPISKKAGYPYWRGLLMGVPLLNLILVWVFAFKKWPNEKL